MAPGRHGAAVVRICAHIDALLIYGSIRENREGNGKPVDTIRFLFYLTYCQKNADSIGKEVLCERSFCSSFSLRGVWLPGS